MGKHTVIAPVAPRLVDAAIAAAYVGRGRTTFLAQVAKGELPEPSDQNGVVKLWDLRVLDRYVDRRSGLGAQRSSWDD